jgi:hypothetical protein
VKDWRKRRLKWEEKNGSEGLLDGVLGGEDG